MMEADGYVLVGESWAAHLTLDDVDQVEHLQGVVRAAGEHGVALRELTVDHAPQVARLESANHADYPQTPATAHDLLDEASTRELWQSQRLFGAWSGSALIGATGFERSAGSSYDIAWSSVLASERGLGLGPANAAFGILTLYAEGCRRFSTGGAATNARSLVAVRSLGMVVDERWRSYQHCSST